MNLFAALFQLVAGFFGSQTEGVNPDLGHPQWSLSIDPDG
jgi:heme A synthase